MASPPPVEVLRRAARLDLPGWYVAAGCLYQTVWNVLSGRPAGQGIKIRNEVRVHLWCQEKFGVACVPHDSTEAAIDTFPAWPAAWASALTEIAGGACTRPMRPRPSGGAASGQT